MRRVRTDAPTANNQHTADRNQGRGRTAPRISVAISPAENARLRAYLAAHGLTLTELIRGRLADALGASPATAVHVLGDDGRALCGMGAPVSWPPDHRYVWRLTPDIPYACPACRKGGGG